MHTIDVGPNLFTLGAGWLILKYLLVPIIILILLIGLYLLFRHFISGKELSNISSKDFKLFLVILCVIGLLVAISIAT
jgi:hypothetical protein